MMTWLPPSRTRHPARTAALISSFGVGISVRMSRIVTKLRGRVKSPVDLRANMPVGYGHHMGKIRCDHEQPCKRFACADTNNLDARTLDEVEYYYQQGRISEAKCLEYITMWNDGPHMGFVAALRNGAIRVVPTRETTRG